MLATAPPTPLPPPPAPDSPPQEEGGDGAAAARAAPDARRRAPSPPPRDAASSRKLVVLGLPWDTDDAALRAHFGGAGADGGGVDIDDAVVLRDRATGRSRGFGFVTFTHAPDAADAVASSPHTIDGRRCEARFAAPRGAPRTSAPAPAPALRCSRVFVARVPPTVTDAEFRAHFEAFGAVTDAYMPRDAVKGGHRGIGFVTFASPSSVDAVVSTPHRLGGADVAVDRATPKERDRGGGLAALVAASAGSAAWSGGWAPPPPPAAARAAQGWGALPPPLPPPAQPRLPSHLGYAYGGASPDSFGFAPPSPPRARAHPFAAAPGPAAAALAAFTAAGDALLAPNTDAQASHQALQGLSLGGPGLADAAVASAAAAARGATGPPSLGGTSATLSVTTARSGHGSLASGGGGRTAPPPPPPPRSSVSAGGPPDARAGPRIFVGKLPRDATEGDVKDHFSKFGYVMDVYLPRDRANRAEHRGFGFVTFETATALRRVVAAGAHTIRGASVAIDAAVPRRDDGGGNVVSDGGGGGEGGAGGGSGSAASAPPASPPGFSDSAAAPTDAGGVAGPARGHEPRPRAAFKPY